jgi:transposase
MWTEITRRKYERGGQRYASDLTDGEWALIEPHMPAAKPLGRPREIELRAVLFQLGFLRVPVDRDHGFRWKMITQSGGT